ncbi:MAG: hypothetical protein IPL99_29485 [Candidatus Competibacteraceae bacterium]|nr:hypothetical protein [Candidatus Competibacteraceae bacterium]
MVADKQAQQSPAVNGRQRQGFFGGIHRRGRGPHLPNQPPLLRQPQKPLHRHKPPLTPYPWEMPGIREDVAKVYNLRLPEPYLPQAQVHLPNNFPASMQQFCLSLLLPAIDAKIAELIHPPLNANRHRAITIVLSISASASWISARKPRSPPIKFNFLLNKPYNSLMQYNTAALSAKRANPKRIKKMYYCYEIHTMYTILTMK